MHNLFPVGRRSLLFGVHQIFWHPWTVYKAWVYLYGRPNWKEALCIFIHDWGYWSCSDMDGESGKKHPELGARIAEKLLGREYGDLVRYHSRSYAKAMGKEPSKLCWPDKLSIIYDVKGFYLLRARLTGELEEYRRNGSKVVGLDSSDSEWFEWIRSHFVAEAEKVKGGAVDV